MSRGRLLACVAAVAVLAIGGAAPASAATPTDALWYYDLGGIDQAHADGWTGEGVTIAVLDSPVNTDVPTLANANIEVREPSYCYDESGSPTPAKSSDLVGPDSAFHGTNVVSYISGSGDGYPGQTGVKGIAPGAKVLYYAVSRFDAAVSGGEEFSCINADGDDRPDLALAEAIDDAVDADVDIISISAGYASGEFQDAYIRAIRAGIIVIGSVANTDDLVVSMNFPAGANGAIGVQAADRDGAIKATDGRPNDNSQTDVIAPGIGILSQGFRESDFPDMAPNWEQQTIGDGTSLAAPMVAADIALAMQKWPDATNNQMIQSLVRNTGGENHEPFLDPTRLIGYGFASATGMLAADPTGYPDENPLFDKPGFNPPYAEIFDDAGATGSPSDEPGGDASEGFPVVGIVVGILVALVVVIGVVVLIVVLVVRRSRPGQPKI